MTQALGLSAALIGGTLLGQITLSVEADPGGDEWYELGNDAYHHYRPPWREREAWYVDGGCGVNDTSEGCSAHVGVNEFAIDLNKVNDECGDPVRAVASGGPCSTLRARRRATAICSEYYTWVADRVGTHTLIPTVRPGQNTTRKVIWPGTPIESALLQDAIFTSRSMTPRLPRIRRASRPSISAWLLRPVASTASTCST